MDVVVLPDFFTSTCNAQTSLNTACSFTCWIVRSLIQRPVLSLAGEAGRHIGEMIGPANSLRGLKEHCKETKAYVAVALNNSRKISDCIPCLQAAASMEMFYRALISYNEISYNEGCCAHFLPRNS